MSWLAHLIAHIGVWGGLAQVVKLTADITAAHAAQAGHGCGMPLPGLLPERLQSGLTSAAAALNDAWPDT
jgi:hypothetical protein